MKWFSNCLMVASVLAVAGLAAADESKVVTIKPTVVQAKARRPIVMVEITREKMNLQLHPLKHPLDERPVNGQAPF